MNTTEEKPIGWLALNEDNSVRVVGNSWNSKHRKLYRHRGVAAKVGRPVPVYLSDCLRRAEEET